MNEERIGKEVRLRFHCILILGMLREKNRKGSLNSLIFFLPGDMRRKERERWKYIRLLFPSLGIREEITGNGNKRENKRLNASHFDTVSEKKGLERKKEREDTGK